eukprot:g29221.t1
MAGYVARYGIGYIKNALVAGTYQHEKGIFFGGKELQPSHVLLRDFMTKRFGTTKAAEVAWVDVHTGLGPTGVDVMLGTKTAREMEEPSDSELFPKVEGECDGYQALGMKVESVLEKRCGSNDVTLNQSGLSASQSAGYEFTVGVLSSEWVTQFFAKDSGEVLQVAQEFGTLGNLTVARAMMLENCGYHYDRANHEYWRSFTRDAFYAQARVAANLTTKGRGRTRSERSRTASSDSSSAMPAQIPAPKQVVVDKTPPEPPVNGTTIMLRNLPQGFTQQSMLDLLDGEGFHAKYDFVYLPMDFRNGVNLGYAFVNTLTHEDWVRPPSPEQVNHRSGAPLAPLGYERWTEECDKVCEVSWAHPHQGLAEHVERYRNSPVMHPSTPEEYKPMIFSDGQRVQFPGPTKAIRAPKLKYNPGADSK